MIQFNVILPLEFSCSRHATSSTSFRYAIAKEDGGEGHGAQPLYQAHPAAGGFRAPERVAASLIIACAYESREAEGTDGGETHAPVEAIRVALGDEHLVVEGLHRVVVEHAAKQLAAHTLLLVVGQHQDVGDVHREGAVAHGAHEADHGIVLHRHQCEVGPFDGRAQALGRARVAPAIGLVDGQDRVVVGGDVGLPYLRLCAEGCQRSSPP